MRPSGFTLLELLIVIGILGILFALSSRLSRDPYAMNAATTRLSTQFSRARMEALRQNDYIGVQVDPTNKRFFIFKDTNRNLTYDAGEDILGGTLTTLPSSDYPNIVFATGTSGASVVFDPRGISRSTTAFSITLTNSAGNRSKTVAVTAQGRANIQ